jgi:hypothetical protein
MKQVVYVALLLLNVENEKDSIFSVLVCYSVCFALLIL